MIKKIYDKLLEMYGPQGWWPLFDLHEMGQNPTKTGSCQGYHPSDYSYPHNEKQKFEICIGAILTQNTSWTNVEKAIIALRENNTLYPEKIIKIDSKKLGEIIKPAGYFNQKSKKLKEFSSFFIGLGDKTPTREALLDIWGIGPETADSILLYAYRQAEFVVDTYTKRIFLNLGLITEKEKYDEIKIIFEDNLEFDYKIFQEYHALLVEHAKRYYSSREKSVSCPIKAFLTSS